MHIYLISTEATARQIYFLFVLYNFLKKIFFGNLKYIFDNFQLLFFIFTWQLEIFFTTFNFNLFIFIWLSPISFDDSMFMVSRRGKIFYGEIVWCIAYAFTYSFGIHSQDPQRNPQREQNIIEQWIVLESVKPQKVKSCKKNSSAKKKKIKVESCQIKIKKLKVVKKKLKL